MVGPGLAADAVSDVPRVTVSHGHGHVSRLESDSGRLSSRTESDQLAGPSRPGATPLKSDAQYHPRVWAATVATAAGASGNPYLFASFTHMSYTRNMTLMSDILSGENYDVI